MHLLKATPSTLARHNMNSRFIQTDFRFVEVGDDKFLEDTKIDEKLNELASYIGWIIMEFNSLDTSVSWFIKEILSHSEGKDELIYLFLCEMNYSQRVNLLIRIYGQLVYNDDRFETLRTNLEKIEQDLKEDSTRRNRYAHADFDDTLKGNFFKVSTKPKKNGVFHTYMKCHSDDLEQDLNFIKALPDRLYDFHHHFYEKILNGG
jgi:hypothetical protein